jgi:anti-anti-sigma factor
MTGTAADMGFRLEATFVGFEAVLALHGEIDLGSASEFGAHLDWAIDQGHQFVVIDLAGLSFMDGSGLRIIGGAAKRLQLSGGALSVRSPSTVVRRLFDIGGLTDLLRIEQPIGTSDGMEIGAAVGLSAKSVSATSAGVDLFLKRVAAVPSDDEIVSRALRLLVALAQVTVEGADGVSISLRRRGTLSTVAASDQVILAMDAGQYETGEGPCVDASAEGRRFHAEALDTEMRWPSFTPKALALGINSILSSPLGAGDTPVGALNIYSRATSAFAVKDQVLASIFAREASLILNDAQGGMTDQQLDDRMSQALRTRALISQAQGVIMHRDGIGEDLAYTRLRRDSLQNGRPLHERAQEVVDSARHRFDDPDHFREIEHG